MSGSLLKISISGLDENIADFKKRAENIRANLRRPIQRAGELTAKTAADRIRAEGPGWIRSKRAIRTGGTTGIDTGAMIGGLSVEEVRIDGASGLARVGVAGPAGRYALYFQNGTGGGGRGGKPFLVKQPARQWKSRGKVFTARGAEYMHGGQPARPFLFFDDRLRAKIRQVFHDFAVVDAAAAGGLLE